MTDWERYRAEVEQRKATTPGYRPPRLGRVTRAAQERNGQALVAWMAAHPIGVPNIWNPRSLIQTRANQERTVRCHIRKEEADWITAYMVAYALPPLIERALKAAIDDRWLAIYRDMTTPPDVDVTWINADVLEQDVDDG
jgi:hypothetical protein